MNYTNGDSHSQSNYSLNRFNIAPTEVEPILLLSSNSFLNTYFRILTNFNN